jgi:hypothetical protein
LKVNFTSPLVVVDTDRLVDEAMNLYKLKRVVVAVTPFIFVVTIALFSSNEILLELMRVVVDTTPFTFDIKTFIAEFIEFSLINLAVVVETTPFTLETNWKELVEVDTVRVLTKFSTFKFVATKLVTVAVPVALILVVYKLANCKLSPTASANSSHCANNSVTSPQYE